MRLPIKDKYFREIKEGKKTTEFRDAHLTLVNTTTKESLRVEVVSVLMLPRYLLSDELQSSGMFKDNTIMAFNFKLAKTGEEK